MNNQLFETPASTPAKQKPRPSRQRKPAQPRAEKSELAPVVNGVCSEHRIEVGAFTGVCRMCVGYGLLQAGWRPLHLLNAEEIAAWHAANEPLPRTRRGYGQEPA